MKRKPQSPRTRCSECNRLLVIGMVLPYWLQRWRCSLWLCPLCVGPVHDRHAHA